MEKFDNFDPKEWLPKSASKQEKTNTITSRTFQQDFNTSSTEKQVQLVINQLIAYGKDITFTYEEWYRIGFSFAHEFGEAGRSYFHDLSRICTKYDSAECDRKYNDCLRGSGTGINIATFFDAAKKAGIDISAIAKEVWQEEHSPKPILDIQQQFYANCANVPIGQNNEKMSNTIENTANVNNMPNGTLAQMAQTEDLDSLELPGKTFSDKFSRDDLPSFLQSVFDSQEDTIGRDKMLLGTINIVSGLLPKSLYSIYDRRKVFPPIYTIIWGPFGSLKGELEACKGIAIPIKNEMRANYEEEQKRYEEEFAEWERKNKDKKNSERTPAPKEPVKRSPFIAANSSASAVYRALDANEGWGIMFETEADTITNMIGNKDYGDYSDLLRKAHHHETISMTRVSDKIDIEIEQPRLSVLITGTGSQLPRLLPPGNFSNGLASRMLFYNLVNNKVEFRNVFAKNDSTIEDLYRKLGNDFIPLYHALEMRLKDNSPIQFVMSQQQQTQFVEAFNEILHEQYGMLGDGIQGFIFRLALECFRISMVLSVLRRLSDWDKQDSIFDKDERALVCDDRDYKIAFAIIECLANHTARVYSVLAEDIKDPFANCKDNPPEIIRRYFDALPSDVRFRTADALEVAKKLGIAERTAKRYLGDLSSKYEVLDHLPGIYSKRKIEKRDNNNA